MFHLPRPHTVARDTQTQRRVTRNTERIFEQEVNRRLQNHINEVNNIQLLSKTETHNRPRDCDAPQCTTTSFSRNESDDDNNSHSESDRMKTTIITKRKHPTHHTGIRNPYYTYFNNLDSINIGGNRDNNHQQTSLSVQHCIIVTIFTAADILVMLLWLYTLNKRIDF